LRRIKKVKKGSRRDEAEIGILNSRLNSRFNLNLKY
jgi:hypothetical protein